MFDRTPLLTGAHGGWDVTTVTHGDYILDVLDRDYGDDGRQLAVCIRPYEILRFGNRDNPFIHMTYRENDEDDRLRVLNLILKQFDEFHSGPNPAVMSVSESGE